jgi:hypothetical protein
VVAFRIIEWIAPKEYKVLQIKRFGSILKGLLFSSIIGFVFGMFVMGTIRDISGFNKDNFPFYYLALIACFSGAIPMTFCAVALMIFEEEKNKNKTIENFKKWQRVGNKQATPRSNPITPTPDPTKREEGEAIPRRAKPGQQRIESREQYGSVSSSLSSPSYTPKQYEAKVRATIPKVLQNLEGKELSLADICQQIGEEQMIVRSAISDLLQSSRLIRIDSGEPGDPHRYRLRRAETGK